MYPRLRLLPRIRRRSKHGVNRYIAEVTRMKVARMKQRLGEEGVAWGDPMDPMELLFSFFFFIRV